MNQISEGLYVLFYYDWILFWYFGVMLQLGAMEGHSLFLCQSPVHSECRYLKKGCQRWRFCSVAHSDVNLWQRVCLYVHVCLCCLTSRSTPHLPHWFGPCTRSPPPPPPPHITSWQNDSPLWPIETPNTVFCPACWGSHQSPPTHPPPPRRTPGPLGYPTVMRPLSFFSLHAPPSPSSPTQRVRSSTVASLNYSSVYISCQEKQKKKKKKKKNLE